MVAIAVEEISKVDASAAIVCDVQNTLVNYPITRYGNDAQRAKYLTRLVGDTVGAYALSEPGSGSDAFGLATRAEKRGDRYVLTGRKMWITNGAEAEIYVVFANANPSAGYKGITAFIVERGFAGFAVGKKEDKLGIRASSTTELILDGCEVPEENVLGPVGQGYKIAIETLNEGRIGIGAQMIGVAAGALGVALDYVRERKQFGKALVRVPGIQFQLAQAAHRARGGAPHGLQRRAAQGRRPRHRARRRDGEAVLVAGLRARDVALRRAVRRLRLHEGLSRSRSSIATRRSARSTRARRTCSCRRSRSCCCADV